MPVVVTVKKYDFRRFCDGVKFALRAVDRHGPLDQILIRLRKGADWSGIQVVGTNRYVLNEFRMPLRGIKAVPAMSGDFEATVCLTWAEAKRIVTYRPTYEDVSIRLQDRTHIRFGRPGRAHDMAAEHFCTVLPTVDELVALFPDHKEALKGANGADLSSTYANPALLKEAFLGMQQVMRGAPIAIEANGRKPMVFTGNLVLGDRRGFVRSLVMPVIMDFACTARSAQ